MGGSKSSSETRTDQSTNISETTNVEVGDIGFTGPEAVAITEALSLGAAAQAQAIANVIANVTGGSKGLPVTQKSSVAYGMSAGDQIASQGSDNGGGSITPLLIAGAAGYFFIKALAK